MFSIFETLDGGHDGPASPDGATPRDGLKVNSNAFRPEDAKQIPFVFEHSSARYTRELPCCATFGRQRPKTGGMLALRPQTGTLDSLRPPTGTLDYPFGARVGSHFIGNDKRFQYAQKSFAISDISASNTTLIHHSQNGIV